MEERWSMVTEQPDRAPGRRLLLFLALGLVLGGVVLFFSLKSPPQMGADEEVFQTVDALYTAVRSRDEKQLNLCQKRLASHREAGKLPENASGYLDRVIAQAREGEWEPAARRLYAFMKVQRREGAEDRPAAKKDRYRSQKRSRDGR
jgi:hypothetical protein